MSATDVQARASSWKIEHFGMPCDLIPSQPTGNFDVGSNLVSPEHCCPRSPIMKLTMPCVARYAAECSEAVMRKPDVTTPEGRRRFFNIGRLVATGLSGSGRDIHAGTGNARYFA